MSTLLLRPARPEDKDAVLAFTATTWDWGDYIQHVWDDWLADPTGELTVAEVDGTVAAISMCTRLSASEGWLQGLRVAPAYRRRGLARALTVYHLDWLRQRGVPIVRLAVYCHNTASQTHVAHMGFRRLTTYITLEQKTTDTPPDKVAAEVVSPAETDTLWPQIAASPTLRAAAGVWANGWAWQRLTCETLAEQAAQEHVWGIRHGREWAAVAIARAHDYGYHVGYVDGRGEALARLARALSEQARQARAEYNTAMLPPVPHIIAAFHQAGYPAAPDAGAMYIYEMAL